MANNNCTWSIRDYSDRTYEKKVFGDNYIWARREFAYNFSKRRHCAYVGGVTVSLFLSILKVRSYFTLHFINFTIINVNIVDVSLVGYRSLLRARAMGKIESIIAPKPSNLLRKQQLILLYTFRRFAIMKKEWCFNWCIFFTVKWNLILWYVI